MYFRRSSHGLQNQRPFYHIPAIHGISASCTSAQAKRQAPLYQSDRAHSVASANKVAARSFLAKRAASIARSPARTLPSALQLSCLPFCPHWQKAAHAPATPCQPPSAALPRPFGVPSAWLTQPSLCQLEDRVCCMPLQCSPVLRLSRPGPFGCCAALTTLRARL